MFNLAIQLCRRKEREVNKIVIIYGPLIAWGLMTVDWPYHLIMLNHFYVSRVPGKRFHGEGRRKVFE